MQGLVSHAALNAPKLLLTWVTFMETIPWFFWDYLAEEGSAEPSVSTDRHPALSQMQFSRCDSCVRPSDIKILIYLLLFNLVTFAGWAGGKLAIVGDSWFWFLMNSHKSKKKKKEKKELQWTQMQLSIFGVICFPSDLLIIPNYNNKYFNLVMALIITFILISRQLWHSNDAHDLAE